MSLLRESVLVETPAGRHVGILALVNGLPLLFVSREGDASPLTPQTFPACWRLSSLTCGELYTAWRDVEAVIERLRDAEAEARPCDDCGEPNPCRCFDALPGRCEIEQAKVDMEARGER